MLRARSSGTKLVLVPTELQLNMDQVYVLVGGILLSSRQLAPVTAEETVPRLGCLVRGIRRTSREKICIVARPEATKQKGRCTSVRRESEGTHTKTCKEGHYGVRGNHDHVDEWGLPGLKAQAYD